MYNQLKKIEIINTGNKPQVWYSNDFTVSYIFRDHDTVTNFLIRNGYYPEWTDNGISVETSTWDDSRQLKRALDHLIMALECLEELKNIDIPEDYYSEWVDAIDDIEYMETVTRGMQAIDHIHDKVLSMYAVVRESMGSTYTLWYKSLDIANEEAHYIWYYRLTEAERKSNHIYVGKVYRGEWIDPEEEGWDSIHHGENKELQWWR